MIDLRCSKNWKVPSKHRMNKYECSDWFDMRKEQI